MYKILIIEDEALIAMQIKTFLTRKNFDVVGYASNYIEAYELFVNSQPNIIICDINLHDELNGIEIVEQLKQFGMFEVLYLTSYSDASTLKKAFATQPFSYITKPFKEIDLYNSLLLCTTKLQGTNNDSEYSYDILTKVLKYKNEIIKFTKQEADLFHICYLNRGKYVPMHIIEHTIWYDESVTGSTKRGLFYRMSKKIVKDIFEHDSVLGCKVNL
jgi:DNA-binding response OmpR family regulator